MPPKAAGIDEYRADRISDYDFGHSRATYLGRSSDSLPGVMYLLGHKQPATTSSSTQRKTRTPTGTAFTETEPVAIE